MTKFIIIEMKILALAMIVSIAAIIWWGLDREPPVVENIYLVESEARAGEQIQVRRDIDRLRQCFSRIEWSLIDAGQVVFNYATTETHWPGEPGSDTIITELYVPLTAKPGNGIVRLVMSWVCNPSHLIQPIVTVVDVPITIQSSNFNAQAR